MIILKDVTLVGNSLVKPIRTKKGKPAVYSIIAKDLSKEALAVLAESGLTVFYLDGGDSAAIKVWLDGFDRKTKKANKPDVRNSLNESISPMVIKGGDIADIAMDANVWEYEGEPYNRAIYVRIKLTAQDKPRGMNEPMSTPEEIEQAYKDLNNNKRKTT